MPKVWPPSLDQASAHKAGPRKPRLTPFSLRGYCPFFLVILYFLHVGCGLSCLILGAIVFFTTKATRFHRAVGTAYVLAMIALNVSALCIYNLTGRFNLFHLFAILSLMMVLVGWTQVVFRRHFRRWFYRHYTYMCWSYA